MPRVIGIDPGTVSIDACGLDNGRLFLDRSLPTGEALADPDDLVRLLEEAGPVDLIAGPSGYGLPVTPAREASEADIRLAYLAAEGEAGGIGGLRSLLRALARSSLPVVFTPGVIHLPSVPAHRKVNRVDMGTADKVCATALAIREQASRRRCKHTDVSCILLELGGAFSAAVAVEGGRIVDGLGGTSGPIGLRSAGALDGEVAYLAGAVSKAMMFGGGAAAVAGDVAEDVEALAAPHSERGHVAWEAYVEGAVKAVATLLVAAPAAREVILSGRMARVSAVRDELARRVATLGRNLTVHLLEGFAAVAKHAAQGAAIIADGLAGGSEAGLVRTMEIAQASGSVIDHLYVITPAAARARLGLA